MNKKLLVYTLVSLLSCVAGPVMAAMSSEVRSLNGLATLRVIVEDLNSATHQIGLRKEHLYALAVQQLLKDGFTVLQPQDRRRVPIVYIRLSSVVGGEDPYVPVSLYVTVQVKQGAVLAQERQVASKAEAVPTTPPLFVSTWERGTMAMVGRSEFLFYVQHILINLLGDLTVDYREAHGTSGK